MGIAWFFVGLAVGFLHAVARGDLNLGLAFAAKGLLADEAGT